LSFQFIPCKTAWQGNYFATLFPCKIFQEIYFVPHEKKTYLLSPTFAALIHVLKVVFFIWDFKINFQEKNMEWQRENMAPSGIMKSFDPLK
jgi:hypothetical protein